MYQREDVGPSVRSGVSFGWLALVLVLFCFPLFVGLDGEDIREDEAIYSFAVDLILETGDWLEPKSIPNETFAFLEKPPLKFWIVAAPVKFGLLPHNEFGMRFWDALFGAISFVYVFLIGSYLLGPICGAIAVLVLFAHQPLLFTHGLRGNNMEAPLMLAYCGGMYHFMAWARTTRRALNAHAVGLYFVLGFMTKFVAVVFLPAVLGAAAVLVPDYRRKVLRDWRLWSTVSLVALALIAPWFVWAWRTYGGFFWHMIFADAIVTRMTSYLDPNHVQPWYFYPVSLHRWLTSSGTFWLSAVGLVVLAIQTVKRRWPEGVLILLWLVLPIVAISFGNSKLYHYVYPFLPPVALAAAYVAVLAFYLAPAPLGRALSLFDAWRTNTSRFAALLRHRAVRAVFLAIAVGAIVIAIVTIVRGPIRITVGPRDVFKSSGILRPLVVAVVFGLLADVGRHAVRVVVATLVLSVLPFPTYRESLGQLTAGQHPIRTARDCIKRVQATAEAAPGMYVDVPPVELPHADYYYFRTIRPWRRAETPAPDQIGKYLNDPIEQRPILVWEPTYQQFQQMANRSGASASRPSMIVFREGVDTVRLLLLPGPYAACSTESVRARES